MNNNKFKLVLDPEKLDLADFDNHALQSNLMSTAKGGFRKAEAFYKQIFRLQEPGPVGRDTQLPKLER